MRLRRKRDLLTATQVGLAVAAVALAGGTSPATIAAAASLGVYALFRPLPLETSTSAQRGWTFAVFVALTVGLYRSLYRAEVLDAGIDFLLVLVVQRLFCRQRCREHLQLLLLGAVLMTIGAVVNADLNYPILLAVYLPTSTMALLVNQLVAEAERLGARVEHEVERHSQRHRFVLWRASTQVAAMSAAAGLIVFLVFPRFGVGVLLQGQERKDMVSGFSNEVKLGDFGRIRSDTRVVMRLVPTASSRYPMGKHLTMHFRGTAFDRYSDGSWSHGPKALKSPLTRVATFYVFREGGGPVAAPPIHSLVGPTIGLTPRRIKGFEYSNAMVRMRVTLEDIGSDLLFVASEPLGVALEHRGLSTRRSVAGGFDRQLIVPDRKSGPLHYEFLARPTKPTREELAAVGTPSAEHLAPYLHLSEDLSPRVQELAESITEGSETRVDKVDGVMSHLRRFKYSLTLAEFKTTPADVDPLEGFLFETREGHCEYFASAGAVLLREVGVPTRVVNGYLGADWNEMGEYYAVRHANAHSWIEVHFGPLGWVTFDPTPPEGRPSSASETLATTVGKWVDALRNTYLQHVIDFGLRDQMALLEQMGVRNSERRGVDWNAAFLWVLMPALGLAAWTLVRRASTLRSWSPVTRIYRSVLDRLAASGYQRRPDESPVRFANRLSLLGAPQADAMRAFAEAYESLRFGEHTSEHDLERLGRLANAVKRGEAKRS